MGVFNVGRKMTSAQIRRFYLNQRKWWNVNDSFTNEKSSFEFIFSSYNILAEQYLSKTAVFPKSGLNYLDWNYRSERILREIYSLNSDILGLQECNLDGFREKIWPSLKKEYEMVFKKKTLDHDDGCSILFRRDKFELESALDVEFRRPELSHWLDRPQIGLMLKLRAKRSPNNSIVVCNTHLLFNPKRGEIKLAQLRLLLAELQRFSIDENISPQNETDPKKMIYHPIIFAGDLNAETGGELIKFLINGSLSIDNLDNINVGYQKFPRKKEPRLLNYKDVFIRGISNSTFYHPEYSDSTEISEDNYSDHKTLSHVFDFKTVYPLDCEDNCSFGAINERCQPDHIFYTSGYDNKLKLVAFMKLLKKQSFETIGPIPNSVFPSDHIPLTAKFCFT